LTKRNFSMKASSTSSWRWRIGDSASSSQGSTRISEANHSDRCRNLWLSQKTSQNCKPSAPFAVHPQAGRNGASTDNLQDTMIQSSSSAHPKHTKQDAACTTKSQTA